MCQLCCQVVCKDMEQWSDLVNKIGWAGGASGCISECFRGKCLECCLEGSLRGAGEDMTMQEPQFVSNLKGYLVQILGASIVLTCRTAASSSTST